MERNRVSLRTSTLVLLPFFPPFVQQTMKTTPTQLAEALLAFVPDISQPEKAQREWHAIRDMVRSSFPPPSEWRGCSLRRLLWTDQSFCANHQLREAYAGELAVQGPFWVCVHPKEQKKSFLILMALPPSSAVLRRSLQLGTSSSSSETSNISTYPLG